MSTVDLTYHVRLGEQILHGSLPRVDTFTFSAPGGTWTDQQWLAQAAPRARAPGGRMERRRLLRSL